MKLLIERSKTDAEGQGAGIFIPRGQSQETCPVTALQQWLTAAQTTAGPVFRKVSRGGVVGAGGLVPDAVRQILLKRAARAGLKSTLTEPVSPHGLRAGFVTTAYRNGVPDEEIMGHTRHRSLTTMRSYGDGLNWARAVLRASWDCNRQISAITLATHGMARGGHDNQGVVLMET
jgi:integrase